MYNVLGRQVGGIAEYKYSSALKEYGKSWSFEEMNGFLKKPASYIKGTKMAFAGLRKEKDRASVILYLNQNSDSPNSFTLVFQKYITEYFFVRVFYLTPAAKPWIVFPKKHPLKLLVL